MSPTETPLVTALARALVGHPWKVVLVAVALSLAGGALAWARLGVETDRMELIGEQHLYNRNFAELQREFGDVDAMVVVLGGEPEAPLRDVAAELARAIEADREHFAGVFWRFPTEPPPGKALLLLPEDDLREVEAGLAAGAPVAGALLRRGLGGVLQAAADQAQRLRADGQPGEDPERSFAILSSFLASARRALAGEAGDAPPWEAFVPGPGTAELDGTIRTQDGRLVLLAQPHRSEGLVAEAAATEALRRLLERARSATPGLSAGLTGGPVLEVDELMTFRRDARLATLASLVGVTLLLLISFRRFLGPLLATGSLLAAILGTLGLATLWPGHLNLISATFCALMAGLGIDYAIHLISRYDEERARGEEAEPALRGALGRTGKAIAGGAITTALAFLATLFTDVQGIREFAVVAGMGILLCLIANLVLLPAAVVLADRGRGGRPGRPRSAWFRSRTAAFLDDLVERRPAQLVLASLLIAAGSLAYSLTPPAPGEAPRLHYDANLLALQAQGLESVQLASDVLHDPAVGGMFAAVVVSERSHLQRVTERLKALPTVSGTTSIHDVLGDQQAKLACAARIAKLVAGVVLAGAQPHPRPLERLRRLESGGEALTRVLEDLLRSSLAGKEHEAAEALLSMQGEVEALLEVGRSERGPARLADYEERLQRELTDLLHRLEGECAREPIADDELPPEIRERLVGAHGAYLVRVHPSRDVWEEEHLSQFVSDVRSVVPDAGGVPVQLLESDRLIRRGYSRAARIALAFVFLYLLVHFRGLVRPLVVLATLGVGASWAMGLLALLELPLNPASLLALPLTLGIGVDYAIHVAHRDREARSLPSLAGAPAVLATSTGRAVFLSSLTTLVGFGALALSAHRGVSSIGTTLSVAIATTLLAAFLFCPAVLRLLAGPSDPLRLEGHPGPKTGPGGGPRRGGQDS